MSVTVRPYVNGGWEVDIRVELPDGTIIRERKKASATGKAAAQRWAEARERVLLVNGKPKRATKEEVLETPTLKEFAPRFVDGYAKANRLKPSGIAGKKSIFKSHLVPQLGDKRLDTILTEDVQRLKSALGDRAAKTVNNILTVLSVMLKTAVEWGSIERVPCVIKLLPTPKNQAASITSRSSNDSSMYPEAICRLTSSSCWAAKRVCDAARSWRSSGQTLT